MSALPAPTAPAPALAGRDDELDALRAALASARRGEAVALALVGEAGLGKSALLATLTAEARAEGLGVLEARASEHERDVPFGATVDALEEAVEGTGRQRLATLGPERLAALASVLPAVTDAAGGPGADRGAPAPVDRFHVHRAVRALVELLAAGRPLVLVLDDLHWADPATLELAVHLLRRPPRRGHVLALAFRPTGAVDAVVDAVRAAGQADERRLRPLDRPAALAALADVPGAALRERLVAEAGGNPLFLRELARAAREGRTGTLPPTIVAAVQREAAGVPPASRALLDGAAVAGDPFDPELAAVAAHIAPEDAPGLLDHLARAGLLEAGDGPRSFRFRHPLVRRAVYDAAPAGWRLGAHERVAAALAARGAPLGARAFHVAASARPGDAAARTLLTEAGMGALRTVPLSAARWFAAARALVPADDVASVAELDHLHAMALAAGGRFDAAAAAAETALGQDRRPAGAARLRAAEQLCALVATAGRNEAAMRHAVAVLATVPEGATVPERAALEHLMANLAVADPAAAVAWGRAAVAHAAARSDADPHGLLGVCARATLARALHAAGEPDAAGVELATAAATAAAAPDAAVTGRMSAAYLVVVAHLEREELTAAAALLDRVVRLAEASAQGHWITTAAMVRSSVLVEQGRVTEALALTEATEDRARAAGPPSALEHALAHQAWCLVELDRPAEARAVVADARTVGAALRDRPPHRTAPALLAGLDVDGSPRRAREALLAEERSAVVALPAAAVRVQTALVRAELALGDRDAAAARLPGLEALATRHRLPVGAARAALAAAHVAAHDGRPDDAAGRAAAAAAAARTAGARVQALAAELVRGEALAAAGDRAGALAVLRAAAEEADADGLARVRAAAARALRRLGERSRLPAAAAVAAAPLDGLAALTARERDIALLVAEGRSNKQAGATLHLSEKTIENNLSRVYAKLGTASRTELAALVAAQRGRPTGGVR